MTRQEEYNLGAATEDIETMLWMCDQLTAKQDIRQAETHVVAAMRTFHAYAHLYCQTPYGQGLRGLIERRMIRLDIIPLGIDWMDPTEALCRAARIICERESGGSDGKT